MIQLTLTLKMTTAQVVETSVTVNNNSPIQEYVHPDDQTQPFEMSTLSRVKPLPLVWTVILYPLHLTCNHSIPPPFLHTNHRWIDLQLLPPQLYVVSYLVVVPTRLQGRMVAPPQTICTWACRTGNCDLQLLSVIWRVSRTVEGLPSNTRPKGQTGHRWWGPYPLSPL